MLFAGDGTDIAKGASGNGLIGLGAGLNRAWDGAGQDVFVQEIPSGATSTSKIKDYDPGTDVIVLAGFGLPLANVPGGAVTILGLGKVFGDELVWCDTKQGVALKSGDAKLVLQGVTADQVDLDLVLFTQASLAETVAIFGSDTGL